MRAQQEIKDGGILWGRFYQPEGIQRVQLHDFQNSENEMGPIE